jgi:predicted nucleotidyltransferase
VFPLHDSQIKTRAELNIVLDEFTARIKSIFGNRLEKVILFGSYARGDYEKESDVDLMLLVRDGDAEIHNMDRIVINATGDIDLAHSLLLSPIIVNSDRFNRYVNDLPFYRSVLQEGVVLYEQHP